MIKLLRTLRLLLSSKVRHYEITSPLRGGGYIIYIGQAPAHYPNQEED